MRKAEMSIKILIVSVVAVLIAIAFIPIFASQIIDVQSEDADVRVTNDTLSFTDGIPFALTNPNVQNDTLVGFNTTTLVIINQSIDEAGYSLLFTDNSTVNMTLAYGDASTVSFNYTYTAQNDTGLSAGSIALLSLVILIFVAFVIVLAAKKFIVK